MAPTASNRRWRGAAAAMAAATLLVGGIASAEPRPGSFSVQPAHSDPADPATQAYFKPVVAPGASFHDQVIVGNNSDQPIDFVISAVDGLTGTTSGAAYANRGDPTRKAGAWIQPAVGNLTIAPNKRVAVGFTVTVPLGALPGDHLAGLAVENANPQTSGNGFQITEVIRAVIGVQIRVPGAAAFHVNIYSTRIEQLPGPGVAAVIVRLGDDGLTLGKAGLTLDLRGPAGYHRTLNRPLDTLLPGDIIDFPFPWPDGLNPGSYDIAATLAGGGADATSQSTFQLQSVLKGADVPKGVAAPALLPPPAPGPSKRTAGGISWWLFVPVALGGVLIGILVRRRPRRESSAPSPTSQAPAGQRPPTVQAEAGQGDRAGSDGGVGRHDDAGHLPAQGCPFQTPTST